MKYVVKSGDTLSKIAKEVYGDANRWREILEANKDQIENPSLIRPGWELTIPGVEDEKEAEEDKAQEEKKAQGPKPHRGGHFSEEAI